MKRISKVFYALLLSGVLFLPLMSGCGGGGGGGGGELEPASSAKAITAFSLDGVSGTINETAKTISVTMPYGTDVTALVATFTTTGASVKVGTTVQASGVTANDFISPVVYTVIAADGTTATYTVTVTVAAGAVNLPKTGQTTRYATGDDGDLQKGIAWPDSRFTVGTGVAADCVTDDLTGLMWVKAPDSTRRTWTSALAFANDLNLCGYTDWRLPNRKELRSLIHYGQSDSAAWLNSQGFSNIQAGFYWSSTTYANNTNQAVSILIYTGQLGSHNKSDINFVLPVRSGQGVSTISLPKTGQTTSYATGDDGDLQKGVAWPNPRFTPGTGAETDCVTDNLTDLMWIKTPIYNEPWTSALPYANDLNLCGHTDWRLPNVNELESLINAGQSNQATWLNGQGFSNLEPYYIWSSTNSGGAARVVSMYGADEGYVSKIEWHEVLAVRTKQ